MKEIRKRFPKAICRRSRKGWAVWSRNYGNKIGEGRTKAEAIAEAKLYIAH